MTEFDYEPTGDVQLDALLQETQEMIQGNNDFILPDEMVSDAIHRACEFFNLPDAPFIDATSVCVWPKETSTASTHHTSHGEDIPFGSGWSAEEYIEKANNCYKEAEYYEKKAARCDDPDDVRHNLNEAKKWRQRGDEYMQKAKYADR